MGQIGFVNICHRDYVNDAALSIAGKAVKALSASGIDIFRIEYPVCDSSEAEKAGRQLRSRDVEAVIIFLGTWIECPSAMSVIREVEHLPLCLWGFPMFFDDSGLNSTGSYVSFAMLKGTMDRIGYKYKPIIGLPDNAEIIAKIICFCKAAITSQKLKRTRIGLVGYSSMSIYPGTFDHVFLRVKIGPEVEQIDSYTLINIAESLKGSEYSEMIDFLRQKAKISANVSQNDLVKASRLFAALRIMVHQKKLDSVNVKCQYEFSREYKMVMCVPLSVLAEFGIVTSCEGDMMNTVSMIILNLLSGQIVTYGDVITDYDNIIKLSSCGFIPFSIGKEGEREVRQFLPHPGFFGIQNSFTMKPGKVTVMRLVEDQCNYHLLYLTGQGLETELRQGYMPALDVRLDGKITDFMNNLSGQHYAIAYGDLSAEIEDLAAILGIRTIRI